MDYANEIKLLKFQIQLLTDTLNLNDHSLTKFLIHNAVTELEYTTFKKMVSILTRRLEHSTLANGNIDKPTRLVNQWTYEEMTELFNAFDISNDEIFSLSPPTFEEFAKYTRMIFGERMSPNWLLTCMKDDALYCNLSDFLLDQAPQARIKTLKERGLIPDHILKQLEKEKE